MAFVIFCTSEINVMLLSERVCLFSHLQSAGGQQIIYAAFIVFFPFECFGKLGIGNENNKYGYYAKHFPNEAFYTMYIIPSSPPLA